MATLILEKDLVESSIPCKALSLKILISLQEEDNIYKKKKVILEDLPTGHPLLLCIT